MRNHDFRGRFSENVTTIFRPHQVSAPRQRAVQRERAYLAPLVRIALDPAPERVDLVVHQMRDLFVVHSRLRASPRQGVALSLFYGCGRRTMVTSRTSNVRGLTVPKRRWNRMECRTARRTSFACRRSRTCLPPRQHAC